METPEFVPYSNMNPSAHKRRTPKKILTNNDEHPKRLLGVFDLRQEIRCEAERQRNLSRLIEVGLQNVPTRPQDHRF